MEEVKDGLNVRVKAIIALAGESGVTVAQVRDGFTGVAIQLRFCRDSIFCGVFAVIVHVVIWSGDALVVGRNDSCAEQRAHAGVMIQLGDSVGLGQILPGVTHVLNHTNVGLKDGVSVLVAGGKTELVAKRGAPGCPVASEGDVDLIEHVGVEVILVRPDARLFKGIDSQGGDQGFNAVFVLNEGIDIGGVSRRVQGDQRGVHVAGSQGWCKKSPRHQGERGEPRVFDYLLHCLFPFLVGPENIRD